jgi:nucleotide-binding universal stress UspA family protein
MGFRNPVSKSGGIRKKSTCKFGKRDRRGKAFYEIIQVAREESADLIVMGTHGRTGIDHLILGSTAENVLEKEKHWHFCMSSYLQP